jgi:FtsP/CotA-like multicopper oxidase with cupredoxin domain
MWIVQCLTGLPARRMARFARVSACVIIVALALSIPTKTTGAGNSSRELISPPVCSAETSQNASVRTICKVKALSGKRHSIAIDLTADTASIDVGGYKVETENYNRAYISPIVRAIPGDTLYAHLKNVLEPRASNSHQQMMHGPAGENPTNLHFFHGGIVTPNNSRPPIDAGSGNGDNIYVYLKNGTDASGGNEFDYKVPIPGEGELDARMLEGNGLIAHPSGLNWYHSHLHSFSSDQVMGGLSGLLSVGEDKANVRAECKNAKTPDPQCDNDTAELRLRTDTRYVLLRDLPIKMIATLPEDARGAEAVWDPEARDFPTSDADKCGVWKKGDTEPSSDPSLRKGFCQRTKDSAWLFTLNGQRFPTITVGDGRNLLLRMGNLSPNVAYWLELKSERRGDVFPLTILSLDGVVPAAPVDPAQTPTPVAAFDVNDLLMMPATRAEIYIRNDNKLPHGEQVYILRTKGVDAGTDQWPEIQLARIVLRPSKASSSVQLALNAPTEIPSPSTFAIEALAPISALPDGCIRDLDPSKLEHRRVMFNQEDPGNPLNVHKVEWSLSTDIFHPPGDAGPYSLNAFLNSDAPNDPTAISHTSFEDYELMDGSLDWTGQHHKHVCIHVDHVGSHKQLWVLWNPSGALHNFHIHQMKFRLATLKDFEDHKMMPPEHSHTCTVTPCTGPDYKFYENYPNPKAPEWHDTIPVPSLDVGDKVFVIMSFDANQQLGRFVFHCHILKHEDRGLMAPIEVWDESSLPLRVNR